MRDRVSRVRQVSLALSASVTLASWGCGSPVPLARVHAKLDLMPSVRASLTASDGQGQGCLINLDELCSHGDTA